MTELTDAEAALTRDYAAYVVARNVYADAKEAKVAAAAFYKVAGNDYDAAVKCYANSSATHKRARANAKEGDR